MTTKILSGTYAAGYAVEPGVTSISITPTGYIKGPGLYANESGGSVYTVVNAGRVAGADYGMLMRSPAAITNGSASDLTAEISSPKSGIAMFLGGSVRNFATISTAGGADYDAIYMSTGTVTNGSLVDTRALIKGGDGVLAGNGAAAIGNFATIVGTQFGVWLTDGGSVTNGAASDTTALIESGQQGVYLQSVPGTVRNFGTILSTGAGSYFDEGVYLPSGGQLFNGSNTDTAALIEGQDGLYIKGGATLSNFGTVVGLGGPVPVLGEGAGVHVEGGKLVNGTTEDRNATIDGLYGVWGRLSASTVTNYGTIAGHVYQGVVLDAGGTVVNGSEFNAAALISGHASGIYFFTPGTVFNYGTVFGGQGAGVEAASYVVNGEGAHSAALIEGYYGVQTTASAIVHNFATIDGTSGTGVELEKGGAVVNGANACRSALIEGADGVDITGAAGTVTNSGTITGAFYGLVLKAGGSLTNGSVNNGTALIEGYDGAELRGSGDLGRVTATNFGTISGLGDPGGFGVILGPRGTLTNGAAGHADALIEGYGGLSVTGAGGPSTVTNFGTILGAAGVAVQFGSAADILAVEAGSTFIGAVDGDGGILDLASGTGTIANLFGPQGVTVSGSMAPTAFSNFDTVEIGAGASFADADPATTIAAGDTLIDNGALTLSGSVANAGQLELNAATLTVGAAGLSLTGAGTVDLSASASNEITGATAASTLTLGQLLKGSGRIGGGGMTLDVTSAGTIESSGGLALTLETGANTIVNQGRIYAEGTAGIAIDSAIDNNGTLVATAAELTLEGAVSGSGFAQINAGTLGCAAASDFEQNVLFTAGATGALQLARSQSYNGTISGFSLTGTTTLDLDDIAYAAATTTATYSGTAANGVLTVTDGTHTAHIHLNGNFTASTWTLSADGHGGTDIVDPAKAAPAAPHLASHTFAQAMAGLATAPHAASGHAGEDWRAPALAVLAPRACAA